MNTDRKESLTVHLFNPLDLQNRAPINKPRNNPTSLTLEPYWEYGPGGSNESGGNYGNQLVGYFVPPADGNYIFF